MAVAAGVGSPLSWLRKVSFRSRISILVGIAVGIAVAMASLVSYVAVSRQLEGQVTSNLEDAVASLPLLHLIPSSTGYGVPPDQLVAFQERTGDFLQVTTEKGWATGLPDNKRLFPMTASAQEALKENPNNAVPIYETLTASNGASYRVETITTDIRGLVVQVGYSLTNVDNTLAFLRVALILVALGGVALAAGLGWAVGRASIRPVEDLTVAVEHVTATQDLSSTINDEGNDELARLARSFNAMLAALAASKGQQAQLVSDAGHELRTPLTSLRTNIEVLMRTKDLPAADREELLSDVDGQLQELTTLVGDLVDLARDDERQQTEPELVEFDELVEHAVERAHRQGHLARFRRLPPTRPGPGATGPARAGRHERTRQRRQMEPRRRASRACRCRRTAPGTSQSLTRARASPPRICPASSSGFTGPRQPGRCPVRAWAWPSSNALSPRTAAPSS